LQAHYPGERNLHTDYQTAGYAGNWKSYVISSKVVKEGALLLADVNVSVFLYRKSSIVKQVTAYS
jgi:hypothetical protein